MPPRDRIVIENLDELKDLQEYLDEVTGSMQSYFEIQSCVLRCDVGNGKSGTEAICEWVQGKWRVVIQPKET